MQHLARFRTTSEFDRNISVTNGDINKRKTSSSDPHALGRKHLVNFGLIATEITLLVFTYLKSTVRCVC